MIKVQELIDLLQDVDNKDAIVTFSDDVVGDVTKGIVATRYYSFTPESMIKDSLPIPTTRSIEGVDFLVLTKDDLIMAERHDYSEEDPMLAEYRINALVKSKNTVSGILSNQISLTVAGFEYIPDKETNENYKDYKDGDIEYRLIRLRDIYTKYEYSFRCKIERDSSDEITRFYELETKLDNDGLDLS